MTLKKLYNLVENLIKLREQASLLGAFVDDRELLQCPYCFLLEDVTIEGMLKVYKSTAGEQQDTGLSFIPLDIKDEFFKCPNCQKDFKNCRQLW